MRTEIAGTVVRGALDLDRPLNLPDQSRVIVWVEPVENWRTRLKEGLNSWREFCKQHPVHSGGRRYSRDELHERD